MDPTTHPQQDCKDHPGRSFDKPQQRTHDAQPPCGTHQSANKPCSDPRTAVTMRDVGWLHNQNNPPQPGPCKKCAPCNPVVETAGFSYTQTNKTNNVKFAHQSLCNPPIASLIKAINAGFLKGGPHLDAHSVQKYLFASPATLKGQLK